MSEFAAQPLPPEAHEAMSIAGLIGVLHFHEANALMLQEGQRELHLRAQQPMKASNYAIYFPYETENIPARHNRIIFGPRYETAAIHDIARVIARFPVTEEDFYPENTSDKPWNDIFLEVRDTQGNPQNYLLNSKGLVPFTDSDNVHEDLDYAHTGDLFTVGTTTLPLVKVSIETLADLMKPDAYVYHHQTNDDDQPFPRG